METPFLTRSLTITVQCIIKGCGTSRIVHVAPLDYEAWKSGKPIQDAMPYLDADIREMLISGICGDCWRKMFPPEESQDS